MAYFNKIQIEKIISFAKEAGQIALAHRKSQNFKIVKKSDGTDVTDADIEVSNFLQQKLRSEFPSIKIVCEEQNLRKFDDEIFFLVDPIDGTSEFISGGDQFCVNIALIKNKKPIFGIIYAPLFEGGKTVFSDENDQIILIKNSGKIQKLKSEKNYSTKINDATNNKLLKIIASKRNSQTDIEIFVKLQTPKFINNYTITRISSAVKFFPLLENRADLLIACRPTMEWDTASGQALVEIFGGSVKNLKKIKRNNEILFEINDDLVYKKADFLNPYFIVYL